MELYRTTRGTTTFFYKSEKSKWSTSGVLGGGGGAGDCNVGCGSGGPGRGRLGIARGGGALKSSSSLLGAGGDCNVVSGSGGPGRVLSGPLMSEHIFSRGFMREGTAGCSPLDWRIERDGKA